MCLKSEVCQNGKGRCFHFSLMGLAVSIKNGLNYYYSLKFTGLDYIVGTYKTTSWDSVLSNSTANKV